MEIYLFTGSDENKIVFVQDSGKLLLKGFADTEEEKADIRLKLDEIINEYLE